MAEMFMNAASDAVEELCGEAFMRFVQFEVKFDNESGGDATYETVYEDYERGSMKDNVFVQRIEHEDLFVGFDVACGDEGGVRRLYAWGRDIGEEGAELEHIVIEFDGDRWIMFNASTGEFFGPKK